MQRPNLFRITIVLLASCTDGVVEIEPSAFTADPPWLTFEAFLGSEATAVALLAGPAALEVASIALSSGSSEAFSFVLEERTIRVAFRPMTAGAHAGSIEVRSNRGGLTVVSLEGTSSDCSVRVEPSELDFGSTPATTSETLELELTTECESEIEVSILPAQNTGFCGAGAPIFCAESEQVTVVRGSPALLPVRFSPSIAGVRERGALELRWCPECSVRVDLIGVGTLEGDEIDVQPPVVDFGTVELGCGARLQAISVSNSGVADARIDQIAIEDDSRRAFRLENLPALPLVLPPGGTSAFEVAFSADGVASDYAAVLHIAGEQNGQAFAKYVDLVAETASSTLQEDTFSVPIVSKLDILLVVDHTPSMADEHAVLVHSFTAFDLAAQAQGLDYQLGVITTDIDDEAGQLVHAGAGDPFGGPLANRIITPASQPSPSAALQQNLPARALADGALADESGLEAAYLALSQPLAGGANAGFVRSDAALSLIFVSDGDDASSGMLDFYWNFFLAIKGFRNSLLFSASAITGDVPAGCSGANGDAVAAPRYVELATRSGGAFESVCSNRWTSAFDLRFGATPALFLSNQPVVATIEVEVDGVIVPATSPGGTVNWTYDFSTNAVSFTQPPPSGATVIVRYAVECS